jgi:localization factor PodJL
VRAGRDKRLTIAGLAALAIAAAVPVVSMAGPIQPLAAVSRQDAYADAVRLIEAHDPSGVVMLRKVAESGFAPAQFYLAKLYETGEAGLPKDAGLAREWTARAAAGGDRKAMHNLALYYFYGEGGPKDLATAMQWFRKAADLGLVDSQYNVGRLYEQGMGVSQDPVEAYRWYLIAARSGDQAAVEAAARVKALLKPEEQARAEKGAGGALPAVATAMTNADVARAAYAICAKGLMKLRYYQGPTDGQVNQALTLALAAWQRDNGLPATGEPDEQTLLRLAKAAE